MSGRRPPQASLPDKETRYRADTTVAITEPGGGPARMSRPAALARVRGEETGQRPRWGAGAAHGVPQIA